MSSTPYATVADVASLWRPLTAAEEDRATALLPVISDVLRQEAHNVGRDLDQMIADGKVLPSVVTAVTVDVCARTLLTSTQNEPMTQFSQSALGYSVSGTYLVPGGGLFVKNTELARLGLKRQRYGVMDFYDPRNNDTASGQNANGH